MTWIEEVPVNLIGDLQDGRDYFKVYSTGGRATYLGLIGWMSQKLNQMEQQITDLNTLNQKLSEDLYSKVMGNQAWANTTGSEISQDNHVPSDNTDDTHGIID